MEKKEYVAPVAEVTELSQDIILISYGEDNQGGYGPLYPMKPSGNSASW